MTVDHLETFKTAGLPKVMRMTTKATTFAKIRCFLRAAFRRGWIKEAMVDKLMSFYDCVGHAVARRALRRVLTEARGSFTVSPRAVAIFDAYIESYAFSTSVLGKAQRELKKKDPEGNFKWPKEELESLYGRRQLPGIGVPQGGSLSCLIANAVLHEADKRIERVREETGAEILYMRYRDDMVILSPQRAACARAFKAYTECLAELLLPAHRRNRFRSITERSGTGSQSSLASGVANAFDGFSSSATKSVTTAGQDSAAVDQQANAGRYESDRSPRGDAAFR